MKKILSAASLFGLALIIIGVYHLSLYKNLSNNLIRLHIIANSNSEADIKTKFELRDEILKKIKIQNNSAKEEIISQIPYLEKEANAFLKQCHIPYSAQVFLCKTFIPQKEYNGIVLPCGSYTAIRIVLGSGEGENWWCVAYPPLCFTEETFGNLSEDGKKILSEKLNEKSYQMITSDVSYKLKIVEISEKIMRKLKHCF